MSRYVMLRRQVANQGRPPEPWLDQLLKWARNAPAWLFSQNAHHDIYTAVAPELGPWRGLGHRRAVMVECLRVLAGFESSWDWDCGRDTTNPNVDSPLNEETGAFQVSADSMVFDPSLRRYVLDNLGSDEPADFIVGMKKRPQFAIGYAARLLRYTIEHNGPVKRGEINQWLSRAAVREAERLLEDS